MSTKLEKALDTANEEFRALLAPTIQALKRLNSVAGVITTVEYELGRQATIDPKLRKWLQSSYRELRNLPPRSADHSSPRKDD